MDNNTNPLQSPEEKLPQNCIHDAINQSQENTSMRNYLFILSLGLLVLSAQVLAGTGHSHGNAAPVSQGQAEQIAAANVNKLVDKGKIDGSWRGSSPSKSEKKKFGDKMEWVVIFKNDKISDPKQRTLYVFLTIEGEYLAANYTGQ